MFALRALKNRIPLLIAASVAFSGCNSQSTPQVKQEVAQKAEQPVATTLETNTNAEASPKPSTNTKPVPTEIDDVIKRVFKDAAILDTSRDPYFVVGDFNGDNSQDIAVVIKPAEGKLAEMNEENPPWMLNDPFNPNLPPQLRSEQLRIKEGETLLAIVHGFNSNGWRNPEATQTYLLKEGAGNKIKVQSAKVSLTQYSGKKTPQLSGDTISEKLGDTQGFLYYAGASYGWYDPGTFKPEAERRMAHSGNPTPK